ncbi:TPA: hypothetical protein ACHOY6_001864 [Raoultella planticola]
MMTPASSAARAPAADPFPSPRPISALMPASTAWLTDFPATDVQVCLRFNIAEGDFSGRRQGNIPLGGGNAVQVDSHPVFGGNKADFSGRHPAQRLSVDGKLRLCSLAGNRFYRAI